MSSYLQSTPYDLVTRDGYIKELKKISDEELEVTVIIGRFRLTLSAIKLMLQASSSILKAH